ncbi:MAG: acetyl-CoA carboxylase biotin carboxyl carrier protein subunit, partial [Deltaproteobacteria bacterium]|nr:acetyl-CoA carboxylase biotin carboxyl carrier protein subunit [Deltaproteobacteria bacterium]
MNGKVINILVNVGDSVQEDAELVIIEAMKMELPIVST